MKRTLALAILTALLWNVSAFAAESVRVLLNGEEVRPAHGITRQDGELLLPLEDLAGLTGSEIRRRDAVVVFSFRMDEGPVVLEHEQTAMLVGDVLYDRLNRRIPLAGRILRKEGESFLPVRTVAEALGYTVKWSRADGAETLSLERPVMPRITLEIAYDKAGQGLTGVICNGEPQTFIYGDDFTLERMTANGWERMREAEPRDINAIGYGMDSLREGLSDGKNAYARRLPCPLPAGHYRIGIPFHFTYCAGMLEEEAEAFWKESLEEYRKDASRENLQSLLLGLDFYFGTKWGEPRFFFDGAQREAERKPGEEWYYWSSSTSTGYVLYGEFTVE